MTADEKLQRIKTECQRLLSLAEKRTPGGWTNDEWNMIRCNGKWIGQLHYCTNNDYIAACAGAAEAGWRATIAAIEAIEDSSHTTSHWHAIHKVAMQRILVAWEGIV